MAQTGLHDLHIRAGFPEAAIEHAQAAGDADTVARLVLQVCNPVMASGRTDTVRRWMEWFEANDLIERYPGLAAPGALHFAVDGRPAATERWADAAEATTATECSLTGALSKACWPSCGRTCAATGPRRCEATRGAPCMDSARPVHPRQHDPGRGSLRSAGGRRRPRRCVLRPRASTKRPRFSTCDRSLPSCSPTAARRDRTGRLGRRRHVRRSRPDDHAWRSFRRLLDERPPVRVGGPCRRPTWRPGQARRRRASRSAPAAAHLRAPRGVGPGAARDGAGLRRARRSGRRGAVLRQANDIAGIFG